MVAINFSHCRSFNWLNNKVGMVVRTALFLSYVQTKMIASLYVHCVRTKMILASYLYLVQNQAECHMLSDIAKKSKTLSMFLFTI